MKTLLYLVPHDSAAASADAPLPPDALRRALVTRNFLAVRPLDVCYFGPDAGAAQTATAIAEPHGVPVERVDSAWRTPSRASGGLCLRPCSRNGSARFASVAP